MMETFVDNYLGITRDDLDSLNPEDLQLSNSAENVLKEFRSLDCTVCAHHFGYQNRWDPKILLCSPRCLSVANNKVKSLPPGQHPFAKHLALTGNAGCKGAVTGKVDGNVDVPRPVQQGLGSQNQVNVQMPRINSRDANVLKEPRLSSSSDRENESRRNERETTGVGNDRGSNGRNFGSSTAVRGGRGGYNNTANRGGRVVGNTSRAFGNGRTDRLADDNSPFGGNEEKQDWGAKATDEIDSKVEDKTATVGRPSERSTLGKENADPMIKSLQMNNKEAMLNAARQARIVRPASKPVENAPLAPAAPSVVNVEPDVKKVITAPPPAAPKTVPVLKEHSETVKQAGKKTWNIEDMTLSLSLINMAPCTISYHWSPSKLTLTALADNEKLLKFQADLNEYCGKAPSMTRTPSVGDIVFALYDGEFYRGRVDKVSPEKKECFVTFIDFGDAMPVRFSDCRDPDDDLMQKNLVYGVIFNISTNVKCPEELPPCTELQAALELEKVTILIESQSAFEFTGKVFLDEKRTWNEVLEKHIITCCPEAKKVNVTPPPVAKPVQPAPSPAQKVPQNPVLVDKPAQPPAVTSAVENKPNPVEGVTSRTKTSNPFGGSKPSPVRRTIHSVQWSPNLDNGAHVHVNYMWGYHKMTISAKEDDTALDKLATLISDYVAAAPPMQRNPNVDEIVIGPYDGAYYRGRVVAVNGDMVDVEFLDYGDRNTVKSSELRELSNEINAHPIYGVVFVIDGVPYNIAKADTLDAEQPNSGQIEIVKMTSGTFTGRLWMSNDSCWNDFLIEHLSKTGK